MGEGLKEREKIQVEVNRRKQLLRCIDVLTCIISALHELSCVILTTTICGSFYCFSHLTEKENNV